ncbi:MAG: hypothetical protein GWN71_31315, partial [Gammaproteobacteria bacterium]|nr:hypothetical protein [Gemmatimonadota bacterium]NIR39732.1 hypothetical protein [Actinomycetota bacterium]NIU77881.1 hypothetical protein [Gammaproteobacteria bacterium]
YALRRDSGCIEWSFEADAAIRGAIAAAPDRDRDDRLTVYFADFLTNVYALDASGGDLQWRVQVG